MIDGDTTPHMKQRVPTLNAIENDECPIVRPGAKLFNHSIIGESTKPTKTAMISGQSVQKTQRSYQSPQLVQFRSRSPPSLHESDNLIMEEQKCGE